MSGIAAWQIIVVFAGFESTIVSIGPASSSSQAAGGRRRLPGWQEPEIIFCQVILENGRKKRKKDLFIDERQ
jgi:hypothetical protein